MHDVNRDHTAHKPYTSKDRGKITPRGEFQLRPPRQEPKVGENTAKNPLIFKLLSLSLSLSLPLSLFH